MLQTDVTQCPFQSLIISLLTLLLPFNAQPCIFTGKQQLLRCELVFFFFLAFTTACQSKPDFEHMWSGLPKISPQNEPPQLSICRCRYDGPPASPEGVFLEALLQPGLERVVAKPFEVQLRQSCPLGTLQCPSSIFLSGSSQLPAEELNFCGTSILLLLFVTQRKRLG